MIFDRVLPYLTGEIWIKFLESDLPYDLGRNKASLEKKIVPWVSELEETKKRLIESQDGMKKLHIEHQDLKSEMAKAREDLVRAAKTTSALQARNDKLEPLLKEIISSKGWAWLSRYRKLKSKLDFRSSN